VDRASCKNSGRRSPQIVPVVIRMEENELLSKVRDLGDLELAILLSVIAKQHCIVTADEDQIHDIAEELTRIADDVFDARCAVVDCSGGLTLDAFRESVLVDMPADYEYSSRHSSTSYALPSFSGNRTDRGNDNDSQHPGRNSLDERVVANVVIAKNLDLASYPVHIQALELIRVKRLFTHTAMHAASKTFIMIAVNNRTSGRKLPPHLNDLFSISHSHMPEDNLTQDDQYLRRRPSLASSLSSMIVGGQARPRVDLPLAFSHPEIEDLRVGMKQVKMSAEVSAYLHNILIFMRLNRYVAGGISALATRQLRVTVKALAVLHGLSYVTPSLVALAVRKTYLHRLILATPTTERSVQWGSDPLLVEKNLRGVTVEMAIEDVLASVDVPL